MPILCNPSPRGQSIPTAPTRFERCLKALTERDALVAGVQIAGALALGSIAWAASATSPKQAIAPIATLAGSLGLFKLYGKAEGVAKAVFSYLPEALRLTRSQLKPAPQATETGVWKGTGVDVRWSIFFDSGLATGIAKYLVGKSIASAYDFGCGPDEYTKVLRTYDVRCLGLDGNTEISKGTAEKQDLARPFKREKRDCVISLEVGAKIPKEHEDTFIQNVSDHAEKEIIISWPVEGQKGPNINCRNNGYIIDKFEELGWKFNAKATAQLREEASPIHYWFRDTLMVFSKPAEEHKID